MDLLDNLSFTPVVVLLVVALVASVAAGSLLMIAVSLALLGVFTGLAYRAPTIERNLDRTRTETARSMD